MNSFRKLINTDPYFYGVDDYLIPDPFFHPQRESMGEQARGVCGNCPNNAIEIRTPNFGVSKCNTANNLNLLGIGKEADYADYNFNNGLQQKWCGRSGSRPGVGPCGQLHYNDTDCRNCGCINLRGSCTFRDNDWAKEGCDYLWFRRNRADFQSPEDGNINANIRWG